MRFLKISIASLLIPLGACLAANPDGFESGNTLYSQGKFNEARQAYQSVVASGNYSANLFYNLANTEFRLGDPGKAALNYERALVLEPSHPEARANLSFVRNQTGAKVAQRSWIDLLFIELSPSTYAIIAAIAGWAAVFCLVAALFKSPRQTLLLAAFLGGLISAYSIIAIRFLHKDASFAIITAKRSDARFAPMENATLVETLSAGSHVRVLTHSGAWVYCDLPNGNRAWLPSETIESIAPIL